MKVLKHQIWHILSLSLLLTVLWYAVKLDTLIITGQWKDISTRFWFLFAIAIPILHQVYVLIFWRLELHHKSISRSFGPAGFKLFKFGFLILFISRLISIIFLSISNKHTLTIDDNIVIVVSVIFALLCIYLFYSVRTYFGMDRAMGIDHFDPDKYKHVPFIKKGIFKYSSNAMYVFGFLILWIPALLFKSKAALLVAAFNHIYIWVHYYFTELPDIKFIYREKT